MARACAFAELPPVLTVGYFAAVVTLTVLVESPWWTAAALGGAMALWLSVRGRPGWRLVGGLVPLLCVVTVVNPLFNTAGATVLLTGWGGRPYTLEALLLGAQTGAMLMAVLLWFASLDAVVGADEALGLFGGAAPSLALAVTLALRLVPSYGRRAAQVAEARRCVGQMAGGGWDARVRQGASVLSAVVGWGLEGSLVTADSLRSRGYGTGPRTRLGRRPFTMGDWLVAAVLLALLAGAVAGMAAGCASAELLPRVALPPLDGATVASLAAFAGFALVPCALNLGEEALWRCSLSRI